MTFLITGLQTQGNLTGTIAIIFFDFAGVNPNNNREESFSIITLGLIVYELCNIFHQEAFWTERLIATIIAGLISWVYMNFL